MEEEPLLISHIQMAEIIPIRPWRYNATLTGQIDELVAPLFDVVSENQRLALYENPYNSIHLSVPRSAHPAEDAARTLSDWKRSRIIEQDPLPGIYVYYQYFKATGDPVWRCRKGFICHIRAYDWDDGVVLRHENTIPKAVNDRVALLEATQFHSSPTHGLYTDREFMLEPLLDEAMKNPLVETEDYQGVRDALAVIHDARVIRQFMNVLRDKTVILADGHHRYESSLIFRKKMLKKHPGENKKGFNYHLMFLTNTESDDLKILPTHRLIRNLPGFNAEAVEKSLAEDFVVKPVDDIDTLNEIIAGKPWAFGIMMKDHCYKVRLKAESFHKLSWPFPEIIKRLDLTILHYFIIERILGIPGKEQRASPYLDFDRSYSDCMKRVLEGDAQMAIITNEVTIDEVKAVCERGHTLPQKSTYFYPKVVGGLLFSSIHDEEFDEPEYSPFSR